MIKLSKKAWAINIGAGTVMVAGLISFLSTTFARPHVQSCTSRYHRQISMALDRDGAALRPADVQAMANGQDEGLSDNLTIAQFSEGPTKYAMGVKLQKDTVEQRSQRGVPGGISLPWMPSTLEQPTAACLSYNLFLPANFDFAGGGTLPGLYGTSTNGHFGDKVHFASNLIWHGSGAPKLYLETVAEDDQRAVAFKTYESALPRGRWVRVDQELILNTPGQADGVARLWLDGRIESEVKGAWIRSSTEIAIAGVAGEVYFGGSGTTGIAPAEATVWLSPFEVRWN